MEKLVFLARQGHIFLEDALVVRVLLIAMLIKHLFLFQVCLQEQTIGFIG